MEDRRDLASSSGTRRGRFEAALGAFRIGKLTLDTTILREDFTFLKSVARRTPKLTIPSPSMLHFRGGRAVIDRAAYPEMDAF